MFLNFQFWKYTKLCELHLQKVIGLEVQSKELNENLFCVSPCYVSVSQACPNEVLYPGSAGVRCQLGGSFCDSWGMRPSSGSCWQTWACRRITAIWLHLHTVSSLLGTSVTR